jgi:uncharacterized repeat protein (TIGR01451 family)
VRKFGKKDKYIMSLMLILALFMQLALPSYAPLAYADPLVQPGNEVIQPKDNGMPSDEDKTPAGADTVADSVYGEPFKFITGVALTNNDGSPFTGDIKKDSKVHITYSFAIPNADSVKGGDTYTVEIPKEIKIAAPIVIKLTEDGTETGNLMATVNIGTDNKAIITFTDYAGTLSEIEGSFFVYTEFDEKKVGNNGDTDIVFDLGGGATTTIKVTFEKEEETAEVKLFKSGNYDTVNNEITWQITVTPETKPTPRPIKNVVIEDAIPAGQTYIGGSVSIVPTGAAAFSFDSSTIKYDFVKQALINHTRSLLRPNPISVNLLKREKLLFSRIKLRPSMKKSALFLMRHRFLLP